MLVLLLGFTYGMRVSEIAQIEEDLAALPQQELLRVAMNRPGMTRAEFAARLSIAVRALDK
ncbi:hypothetical protein WI38_15990 [Burkholderia ubonensis]|uniref:Uncharacterized protein n=1 Tax=Burkholderia ubonensis TaxID=101571 RepID=A0A102K611_9BURK|nr:hypothetical protein [Burkholderia ubonensis]KUZ69322.1 hypothetical protein WI35_01285 [Burkholderia ubonensis]KUZ89659.1 hypothetical protein WI38_15990 [Burkholderia ubonensis]KVA03431.1 hypothetical protein WI39_31225 [Burkholderia ubonensis]